MPQTVTFEVEQAGCSSCASRVRSALGPLGAVQEIAIDERTDSATVRVAGPISEDAVAEALASASAGSGHAYRIRPGSWRADG